jgi:hypothetical protein
MINPPDIKTHHLEGKFIFLLCLFKIYFSDSTYTTESLGKLMYSSPRSVAKWIHGFNEAGNKEILRDKEKPGRSTRVSEREMGLL